MFLRRHKLSRQGFCILVSLTVALVGCRSQKATRESLVGNWEGKNSKGDVLAFFQFRDNGTGGCAGAGRGTALGAPFHYRVEDGAIITTNDDPSGDSMKYRYKISRNHLVLKSDEENVVLRPAKYEFADRKSTCLNFSH